MRCPVVKNSLPWRAAGGDALGMGGICVAWRCLEVPTLDFCLLVPAATYAGRLLPPGVQATVSHDHGKIKVQELYVASRREPGGGIHSFRSFVAQGFDTCEHISSPIGISGDIGKGGAQRGTPGSKMSPII
jgi:hypothetical protein